MQISIITLVLQILPRQVNGTTLALLHQHILQRLIHTMEINQLNKLTTQVLKRHLHSVLMVSKISELNSLVDTQEAGTLTPLPSTKAKLQPPQAPISTFRINTLRPLTTYWVPHWEELHLTKPNQANKFRTPALPTSLKQLWLTPNKTRIFK